MAEPASVDPAVPAQAYLPRVVRPEGKAGREQPKQAAHNTEANKMAARKANNAENPSKKNSREANKKARKKHPAKMKQQKGQKRRPAKMNSRKASKKTDQKNRSAEERILEGVPLHRTYQLLTKIERM